ncbi:MAG: hypothetical protein QM570_09365 [Planctomycetota bacterium]|jgi:hypothetical protein|nr:hypothetical protein [Planctomycetota bacterium]
MKKYTLLLAVLAMSTSAWGFGIGNVQGTFCPMPTPCPTPNPCPTPCITAGAVVGGSFSGQTGLLYSSPCTGFCKVDVDSCQGAISKQGQIGCMDWGCYKTFGGREVSYCCPNPWGNFGPR